MNMEGICEGYQEIEYYHICSITDSAAVIGHITLPFCYNEFTNLTEERKGDECMRKLMSKKHKLMHLFSKGNSFQRRRQISEYYNRKYPELQRALSERNAVYNDIMNCIEALEEQGTTSHSNLLKGNLPKTMQVAVLIYCYCLLFS